MEEEVNEEGISGNSPNGASPSFCPTTPSSPHHLTTPRDHAPHFLPSLTTSSNATTPPSTDMNHTSSLPTPNHSNQSVHHIIIHHTVMNSMTKITSSSISSSIISNNEQHKQPSSPTSTIPPTVNDWEATFIHATCDVS
mmetsp:Transcript_12972/g.28173  ORF Transcript_12972/g.28173 Transcript_12972/m.28173 type:complete len:139 (+) Transcript_12972:183-599(+)